MVVILADGYALVADHGLSDVHPLDEPKALELVEDPVDAGPAHAPRGSRPQRILDLDGRQRAALAREHLQHRPARAATLAARQRQRVLGILQPAGRAHASAADA